MSVYPSGLRDQSAKLKLVGSNPTTDSDIQPSRCDVTTCTGSAGMAGLRNYPAPDLNFRAASMDVIDAGTQTRRRGKSKG
jgi:hypothetical protein